MLIFTSMKHTIFLFLLSISIIHLFNSCEESEVTTLNSSEIYVLNNCQLSCLDDYEQSESLKLDLSTGTYPQFNELSNIASSSFALTEKLDSITRTITSQINHLKIKTIERSSDKSITNKNTVISKESIFDMSPTIVDLTSIQLIKNTQYQLLLPTEVQSLQKNIELLRIYHVEQLIAYFELQSLENLDKQKHRNFSEQYSMIQQSRKKVRGHLCGAGPTYRIEQINLSLSYNDYQWKELSSKNTSLPIVINELTSLQADLFKTRIKVFELFKVHLYCQKLILRDQE
jgi:hypothetical protein